MPFIIAIITIIIKLSIVAETALTIIDFIDE